MTEISYKIKETCLDKSNYETLMQNELPEILSSKVVDIEILSPEKGSVNPFMFLSILS